MSLFSGRELPITCVPSRMCLAFYEESLCHAKHPGGLNTQPVKPFYGPSGTFVYRASLILTCKAQGRWEFQVTTFAPSQHVCIAPGAWQGREQCPGQQSECWSSSLQPVAMALHPFLALLFQCLFSLPTPTTKPAQMAPQSRGFLTRKNSSCRQGTISHSIVKADWAVPWSTSCADTV